MTSDSPSASAVAESTAPLRVERCFRALLAASKPVPSSRIASASAFASASFAWAFASASLAYAIGTASAFVARAAIRDHFEATATADVIAARREQQECQSIVRIFNQSVV